MREDGIAQAYPGTITIGILGREYVVTPDMIMKVWADWECDYPGRDGSFKIPPELFVARLVALILASEVN